MDDYLTINEGIFKGVSYRIRDAEIVEEGGNHFIKFDYDAKGLDDDKAADFENTLGQLIIKALEEAVKEGEKSE